MESIDNCKTLAEITKRRCEQFDIQKANGDNYNDILVRIYEKPTHFVYELLQNADDAGASKVRFELKNDELVFSHNGTKDFSTKDIISITGVGNSTKRNTETVGKFGVGFKSVFAITSTPCIYNRAYNFRIEELIIPYEIQPIDLGNFTTIFKLPFNAKKYTPDELVVKISEEFNNLDCATIMFLRNISSLEIINGENVSLFELTRNKLNKYEVVSDLNNDNRYFLFKNKDTKASIAYAVSGEHIEPLENIYLYSFLPTRIKSSLPFFVDAPFELATTRESLDFDSENNRKVLSNISGVFAESLLVLRDEKYIDQNFLNDVLPINDMIKDSSEIYSVLYESLKDIFLNNSLLPAIGKGYCLAKDACLYSDYRMVELDSGLFNWLSINTGQSRIRTFLKNELDAREIAISDFARAIAPKLNLSTSNEWLYDFYELCAEKIRNYYPGEMRLLPIIKTRNGKFRSAYNKKGEEILFRPSKGLQPSQIINSLFLNIKDETRRRNINSLLDALEIKERTPAQTIQKTILSKWDKYDDNEKIEKFFVINNLYNEVNNAEDKSGLIRLLRDKPIFRCTKNSKFCWNVASDALVGTEEQRILYENTEMPILDKKFFKKNKVIGEEKIKGTEDLCCDLGMEFGFPFKDTPFCRESWKAPALDKETIKKCGLSTKKHSVWWSQKECAIAYFDQILGAINSSARTDAIISLLTKIESREKFIEYAVGCSGNGYVGRDATEIPARFIRMLNDAEWIFTNEGNIRTEKISKRAFVDKYRLTGHEMILDWLDFMPEIVDQLPPEQREWHELLMELPPEKRSDAVAKLREIIENEKDDNAEGSNGAELNAEEIDIEKDFPALSGELVDDDSELASLDYGDIMGEAKDGVNQKVIASDVESDSSEVKPKSLEKEISKGGKYRKVLGDHVESKVRGKLIKEYGEDAVKWYGDNNKGYDFKIEKDGEDVLYIDSKAHEPNGHVQISPSQWNYARIHRDKYMFYVVDEETGKVKKIVDPYGLYLENKINIDVTGFWYKVK